MATAPARLRPLIPAALVLAGCANPDVFLPPYQPGGPAGILGGTVTYSGPLPCTENHHVVGAAVLFAFDSRLLPPPDGLGTSAASVATVGGDVLFGGVLDQLTFNPDDLADPSQSLWCPPNGTSITVSADFILGAVPGGSYEVRGFYDLKGRFDPAFSFTKLPHQGDIAGGAIDNVSAFLMDAAPVYRRITLGAQQPDGSYQIPAEGSTVDGIAVTLGRPLALDLPIFHPTHVLASKQICQGGMPMTLTPPPPDDVNQLAMPCDYTLPDFSVTGAEGSLLRVQLTAGVDPSEAAAASASHVDLAVTGSATFAFSWQDVNGDGMIDLAHDHVAASNLIPALFPLSIFTKLASPTDHLTLQTSPFVVIQGLTIYKDLLTTVGIGGNPTQPIAPSPDVFAAITPAVLCLDPSDFSPAARAKLVLTHLKDCQGMNNVLMDAGATTMALQQQFGRPVDLVEGCLPQGRYMMNLIYGTGQAWFVPNEIGVCAASEPESADGTTCVGTTPKGLTARARLASQDRWLTVGAPDDASYCMSHQTPPECCPPLADANAPRVDAMTGFCKCPNLDPTNPRFACP
jgi:hypothetical protein